MDNDQYVSGQDQSAAPAAPVTTTRRSRGYVPPSLRRKREEQEAAAAALAIKQAEEKAAQEAARAAAPVQAPAPVQSQAPRRQIPQSTGATGGWRQNSQPTQGAPRSRAFPGSGGAAGGRGGRAPGQLSISQMYPGLLKDKWRGCSLADVEAELFAGNDSGIHFDSYDDIPVEVNAPRGMEIEAPEPINHFNELTGLHPQLEANIAKAGYA
ncbi:hypothetical protein KIPB_010644, partial [Kipferlia bialata]|eukprot:g6647.t1